MVGSRDENFMRWGFHEEMGSSGDVEPTRWGAQQMGSSRDREFRRWGVEGLGAHKMGSLRDGSSREE